jgi:hypothetical protein
MTAARKEDEHPRSPDEAKQYWSWKPSSGEGSAAALHKLKRAERVKSTWRRVRGGPVVKPPSDDNPPSAE